MQIFNSNPRMWRSYAYSEDEISAMTSALSDAGVPLFMHSIYLINLSSPDPTLRTRSAEALSQALVLGAKTQAVGVVTHIGSHKGAGFEAAAEWILAGVGDAQRQAEETLQAAIPLPRLLLENSPGSGSLVGGTLEELARLIAVLPTSCGICLDTAHLFAAGIPAHTAEGLEEMVLHLQELDLLSALGLVHLNDSKTPFASGRDRHDNPGEGLIGSDGLSRLVRHPAFRMVPFILEVPGADGHGPDALNVRRVQAMRAASLSRPAPPARPASRQEV